MARTHPPPKEIWNLCRPLSQASLDPPGYDPPRKITPTHFLRFWIPALVQGRSWIHSWMLIIHKCPHHRSKSSLSTSGKEEEEKSVTPPPAPAAPVEAPAAAPLEAKSANTGESTKLNIYFLAQHALSIRAARIQIIRQSLALSLFLSLSLSYLLLFLGLDLQRDIPNLDLRSTPSLPSF